MSSKRRKPLNLKNIPPQHRLQSVDLRDIGLIGEDPVQINNWGDEDVHKELVNDFKKNKKKGRPRSLARYGGPRRFLFPDGKEKALIWRGGQPLFVPFEDYQKSLIKSSGIPKDFITELKKGDINPQLADDFAVWFRQKIMRPQLNEQQFFKRLGKLYADFGFEPASWRQSTEVDLSHYHPKSKGGRFTFLENWLVNQSRRDDVFIELNRLKQADIPVTYSDLWHHYNDFVLGDAVPWYGSLENINIDDVNALSRGDEAVEVIARRQSINQILSKARELSETGSKEVFYELEDDYKRLTQASRGFDYTETDNSFINLEDDVRIRTKGLDITDPSNINMASLENQGYGFSWEYEDYKKPTGMGIKTKGYDVDVDTGGPKGNIKGIATGLAGGLTIGSILSDTGMAAINPETAQHAGEGLAKFQDTGEVDMANVKGAAVGIGKDLALGTGINKALQFAGKRALTHAGAKSVASKAVPWIGIPLLAYGIYDTADAFTEGYTGKGLNERIGEQYNNIVEDAFSPENSFFKRRFASGGDSVKVEPEHDIQGTL